MSPVANTNHMQRALSLGPLLVASLLLFALLVWGPSALSPFSGPFSVGAFCSDGVSGEEGGKKGDDWERFDEKESWPVGLFLFCETLLPNPVHLVDPGSSSCFIQGVFRRLTVNKHLQSQGQDHRCSCQNSDCRGGVTAIERKEHGPWHRTPPPPGPCSKHVDAFKWFQRLSIVAEHPCIIISASQPPALVTEKEARSWIGGSRNIRSRCAHACTHRLYAELASASTSNISEHDSTPSADARDDARDKRRGAQSQSTKGGGATETCTRKLQSPCMCSMCP